MKRPPEWRRAAVAAAALAALAQPAAAIDYLWTTGDYTAGVTSPNPLTGSDRLVIGSGGLKFFNGGSFTNAATVAWTADTLYLQSGALVTNTGLWDSQADTLLAYNGGPAVTFANHGSFRKSGGSGATVVASGTGFVNDGVIDAQTGSIRFDGGAVFNAGSSFTGAGSVVINGNNSFAGAFSSQNLVLANGTFSGNGAVLASGSATFSGGALAGGWTIAAGQTLAAQDGSFKYLSGAGTQLVNQGTLAWNTGNALYFESGARLANSGLVVANADATFAYNGGPTAGLDNTGTLRAAAGHTLTIGSIDLVNAGGTLDAQAGATLLYAGGTSRFQAGTQFTGAGENRVVSNAAFEGAFTSANLVLAAGTFNGAGAVLQGDVHLAGGALAGEWTVAQGHTLRGVDGGFKYLDGPATQLTNRGTVSWDTTNAWYLQNGATFSNQGSFVANADTVLAFNGGSATTFDNTASGTVRAATGHTLTVGANVGFVNHGGRLQADDGAAIVYGDNAAVFNDGTRFTGSGANRVVGTARFNGGYTSENLVLQSGSFIGSGAVMGGNTVFSGGSFTGDWTVGTGQQLTAADGGFKFVDGGSVINLGTVAWNTSNAGYLQNGATVSNRSLFVANADTVLAFNGGAATTFDNTSAGTLQAAAGRTLTLGSGVGFTNHGGRLQADAGGAIVYAENAAVFNEGTRFTGSGVNRVAGSARFNGGYTSENLLLQNGNFTGNGAVMGGTTTFSGGLLTGTWTVGAGQRLVAAGGGFKYLDGGGTQFTNAGTLDWGTNDAWYLQNGASLRNTGRLEFSADGLLAFNGGAAASVVNDGLIVKTGGSGTTHIGDNLGFDNRGTVDVQVGTIALPTNFTNHGTLTGGGAFALNGTLTNEGHVAPGASPGTLTLAGHYLQTAAGSLDIDLQNTASADLFVVNGNATLGGTLALTCWGACSFAVGDQVVILDATGELSGSFAAVTMTGFGRGAFDVIYDTVQDRVLLQATQTVSAVPEPGTWALFAAGGLVMLRGLRRRERAYS